MSECQYISGECPKCGHEQIEGVRRWCGPIPSAVVVPIEVAHPTITDFPSDFVMQLEASAQVSRSPGLGDMVKAGLSAIGITEERVSAALGRPCGCSQRAEALNEFGRKIGIG